MKIKKLLMAFVLVVVGFLAACGDNTEEIMGKLSEIEQWVLAEVPETIYEDVNLPTSHPELGGEIVWASTDETVLTSEGVVVLEKDVQEALLTYDIKYQDKFVNGIVTINVISFTASDIAEEFEDQFSFSIARDYDIKVEFNGIVVEWESSNPEIFSNDGIYNKPFNNEEITITYDVVLLDGTRESFSFNINVIGMLFSEKTAFFESLLAKEIFDNKLITEDIALPAHLEEFGVDFTWESSNPDVISNTGKVTRYPFDRYVQLTAKTIVDDIDIAINTSVIVKADDREYTQEEKINAFLDAISISELNRLTFGGYGGITQSYNFIPFYENVKAPLVEQIIPLNSDRPEGVSGSRPGTKLASLEFITIHDTANTNATADAEMHARLLTNGYGKASWHLSIDENGAYQSIPFDEVAWHAGDGSRLFGLSDTGIKANGPYPTITISKDGYYELNGEKSLIKAPTNEGRILETRHITDSGIYTTIGENGNYYINRTYFNTSYSKISNHGGNRNSIGIETAVNRGSDYGWTVRHTAKLVAELLIEYDLGIDRILQHNNFSGKPCPNSIRHTGYWDNFLDLTSLEKFAKEELSDVEFAWESLTDVLDDKGTISFDIGETEEIEYKVTVNYGEEVIEKTFKTTLN